MSRLAGEKPRGLGADVRRFRALQNASVTISVGWFIVLLSASNVPPFSLALWHKSNSLSLIRRLSSATDDLNNPAFPNASGADAPSTLLLSDALKTNGTALAGRADTVEALKLTGQLMQECVVFLSTLLWSSFCLVWQKGVHVRYGIFAGIALLASTLIVFAWAHFRSRSGFHSLFRYGALGDADGMSLLSPTQWIGLNGSRYEVRLEHDRNVVYALGPDAKISDDDDDPDEQRDELAYAQRSDDDDDPDEQRDAPAESKWVQVGELDRSSDGTLALYTADTGINGDTGVFTEKCIL
ncbi:unnamed protein product [Prorocentrum cordatum]|uniref:Uncharacterized protein n=1 Tax=Prorocentrum cordatum TaxID=2364126 RepID=A0ABN9SDQ1_9DINO|nr:unnamed protein product [Polarella glacialis]